ncbi:Xaa-Pro peptidase family protein [Poseidonocella sp. HB161398]|uniref:M24 family metallopeptidase n=1 Tax=Poseidonocella sp. HB161398 TaxID=2320855 RepID=UPI001107A769|nr:Xaa-Pro peptidase family protein [Poseidonocella sp. HB161398]
MSEAFVGFDLGEYASRQDAVRRRMEESALDALIVSAPENIYYLSGYQTKAVFTFQFLLMTRQNGLQVFTRQMEHVNARNAVAVGALSGYSVYQDDEDPIASASAFLDAQLPDGATVGLELGSWAMPAQRYKDIVAGVSGRSWRDASTMVDRLRLVKSPAELAVLREAGRIGDKVADNLFEAVRAGASENDLAAQTLTDLVAFGSEYPASWPNIMSGARTGLIHATWEGNRIDENDHVVMEITGVKGRYHAPSMRTILVGDADDAVVRGAEALVEAQAAAVAAIEPGAPLSAINDAAMAVLDRRNHGLTLARRSGYSLGIGFPPSWGAQWQVGLNSVVKDPLEVGMAFHVVCVGHLADGRAVNIGCTVALEDSGPVKLTRGGLFRSGQN